MSSTLRYKTPSYKTHKIQIQGPMSKRHKTNDHPIIPLLGTIWKKPSSCLKKKDFEWVSKKQDEPEIPFITGSSWKPRTPPIPSAVAKLSRPGSPVYEPYPETTETPGTPSSPKYERYTSVTSASPTYEPYPNQPSSCSQTNTNGYSYGANTSNVAPPTQFGFQPSFSNKMVQPCSGSSRSRSVQGASVGFPGSQSSGSSLTDAYLQRYRGSGSVSSSTNTVGSATSTSHLFRNSASAAASLLAPNSLGGGVDEKTRSVLEDLLAVQNACSIPGIGNVCASSQSSQPVRHPLPVRKNTNSYILGVFGSEEYEKIDKLPRADLKMKEMMPWLEVVQTFATSVQNNMCELIYDIMKDINNLSKRKNHRLRSPEFPVIEESFIRELYKALPNLPIGHQTQIRKMIEKFPARMCFRGEPREPSSLFSLNSSRAISSKKPTPTFIPREIGQCKYCSVTDDIIECNWCRCIYCRTCLSGLHRAPCSECKRSMSSFDKVICYQSTSFKEGLDRIKGSFRKRDEEIEEVSFELKLYDSYSHKRIEVPVKGKMCTHRAVFDLSTFFLRGGKQSHVPCLFCGKMLTQKTLEVDGFVKRILGTESPDCREVIVFPNGRWEDVNEMKSGSLNAKELMKMLKKTASTESVDLT